MADIYDATGRKIEIGETIPVWKWTDADLCTHGGNRWARGNAREAPGSGPLGSAGWLHAYHDPLLAVLIDPMDGRYACEFGSRLWRGTGVLGVTDGYKVGCTRLTLLAEEIPPAVAMAWRVRLAILCALAVADLWDSAAYRAWAEGWLSGQDRSSEAAARAFHAAIAVREARAAALDRLTTEEWEAWAATTDAASEWAAWAATWTAEWAAQATSVDGALDVARAVAWAVTWTGEMAAEGAKWAALSIDLAALARRAIAEEPEGRDIPQDVPPAPDPVKAALRNRELEDRLFALGAMRQGPCFCCGYNGPGYFDPQKHPCAARHHAALAQAEKGDGIHG